MKEERPRSRARGDKPAHGRSTKKKKRGKESARPRAEYDKWELVSIVVNLFLAGHLNPWKPPGDARIAAGT